MDQSTTSQSKKTNKAKIIIPIIILIGAGLGFKSYYHSLHYESTDNAQIDCNTEPIISRVAGYIDDLRINDYQEVKVGDTLLQIDNRENVNAVKQAEADLMTAEADLLSAQSNFSNSLKSTDVAAANLQIQSTKNIKYANDLKRDNALLKDGSITQKQFDDTKSNVDINAKQLTATEQQLSLSKSQENSSSALVLRAKALVDLRKAQLDQAKLKLSYTTIIAPINGRIGKKNLANGQYLQPGQTLFTIVSNEDYWIIANFKETQLEKMKVGQAVDIKIDGYPNINVIGKVASFSDATGARFSLLPPDNASGNFVKVTQRVPVKIQIENIKDVKQYMKAGLSVIAEVKVD